MYNMSDMKPCVCSIFTADSTTLDCLKDTGWTAEAPFAYTD